ncbi:MAG: hypothetical protein K2H92_07610 [Bacteroidaceae bacterium]|nr:hypothetical protein [Bacteroidaceae bacterium]
MSNATTPSVLPQKYSNTFSAVLQYFCGSTEETQRLVQERKFNPSN